MKIRIVFAIAMVASLLVVGELRAQEQEPAATVPVSANASSSLDIAGIKKYLLGPGDVLDIRFFGQPDLNASAQVDSDGNISSLPFLEKPILAKCRNEKEVQKEIALAYSKLIKNPQISVRVVERNSRQPATVFGAVRQPTRVEMKRRVRLNELMAVAGGFTERAAGTIQILHTEPLMCPEPGEEAEAQPIDGTKMPLMVVKLSELRSGKKEANPVIRPGDYVLVTEAEPVYITGSVMNPTGIYLRDRMTLGLALGMVGGARREAKISAIKIWRLRPDSTDRDEVIVDYAAIKKNQKPDVLLEPYDVIEVPEQSMFSGSRFFPTILAAITGGMTQSVGTAIPNRVIY
jgi:polysaccharide biosynthesis/export protein